MTDDERRRDLLDRWAELAPKECARKRTVWWLHDDEDEVVMVEYHPEPARPWTDRALILHHALTCAARRGWTIEIEYEPEGLCPQWTTEINVSQEIGRAPDLAVLSAYVSALEASPRTDA